MKVWLGLFLALLLAAPSQARLRSPHLVSSCQAGFAYKEVTLGRWIAEGCHKDGQPKAGENVRHLFKGKVELNGMLVKGDKNLVLTKGTEPGRSGGITNVWRVTRDHGTLVLDPKIGGTRRSLPIYTGDVDFELRGPVTGTDDVLEPVHLRTTDASAASTVQGGDTFDIPVGSDAKILGMRLGGTIHDAKVSATTDGGSITFKPRLMMGATASALLRDWIAKVKVETVDGTGMKLTGLTFAIPNIAIPGIGGFKNLSVTYSENRDEWSGSVDIDLGDVFPGIKFDMSVSASTGAPTAIEVDVSPLNVALGPTGIFLQGIRGGFDTNPLILNSGVTLTGGPEFAGVSVVELNGDIEAQLEPIYRTEITGNARFFPTGANAQIARGDAHVIIDSRGYLSIGGSAGFEVSLLGVGARADIGGSGDYSSVNDRFNIEAHATGTLLLGFLGDIDVVRYGAVISSEGWGTCGNVIPFVQAGVGQHWDRGPVLIMGCDLSPFETHVPDPGGRSAPLPRAAGERARTFDVAAGTKTLAVEITGDAPEPRAALFGPDGKAVAATAPAERFRRVGDDVAVIAPPGSALQYVFLRNPPAGRYTLRWGEEGGQVTGLRFARDVKLSATVEITRDGSVSGRRKMHVTAVKGLGPGEQLEVGIRTADGVLPVGLADAEGLNGSFDEVQPGGHQIVGNIVRDGVPLPSRTTVLGEYTAVRPPRPKSMQVERDGQTLTVRSKLRKDAEPPASWQYVATSDGRNFAAVRAKPGQSAQIEIPPGYEDVTISARPVVGGQMLKTKPLVKHVS